MTMPLVMVPEPVVALGLCLKGAIVLAAAWAASASLRRSAAATRHQAWVLGVALALAVAVLAPLAPRLPVAVPIHLAPGRGLTLRAIGQGLALLSTVWMAGAIAVGCWFSAGHLALARMVFRARRSPLSRADGISRRAALTSGTRAYWSDDVVAPLTWGMFRPVILLPAGARAWPADRRRAALLHERAHAERRDPLTQALAALVCTLFWFNPLAWLARDRMRVECERACDDRVLRSGFGAPRYAAHLLAVARTARRQEAVAAALGMASSAGLEARVRAILDPDRPRKGGRAGTALVIGSLLVLLPLACLRPRLALRIEPVSSVPTVQLR